MHRILLSYSRRAVPTNLSGASIYPPEFYLSARNEHQHGGLAVCYWHVYDMVIEMTMVIFLIFMSEKHLNCFIQEKERISLPHTKLKCPIQLRY